MDPASTPAPRGVEHGVHAIRRDREFIDLAVNRWLAAVEHRYDHCE
jgi:hypothetical protein